MCKWSFPWGVCLAVVGSSASVAQSGSVLYVDAHSTSASPDGVSWCSGFTDLQDAFALATSGDEIRVADGVYTPDRGTGDRTSTFRLVKGAALRGGFAGCGALDPDAQDRVMYESILSGDLLGNDEPDFVDRDDNVFHVVTNNDPTTTTATLIEGFIISGGFANGIHANQTDQGSGLHNHNGLHTFLGKLAVRDCTFRDNWVANHGAFNDHGGSTITGCDFQNNFAQGWGGGLYVHVDRDAIVTDCRFTNNETAGELGGGGGVVNGGDTVFSGCLFSGNKSYNNGGGVYNHAGSRPTFMDSRFIGNDAVQWGGGMHNTDASNAVIERCTFAGNVASGVGPGVVGSGGGIYNWASAPKISDSTFSGNVAFRYGGAISNVVGSNPVIRRCTFENNEAVIRGGALDNATNSNSLVTDSIFRNNFAALLGGAIANNSITTPTYMNCIFSGNRSDGEGGAMYNTAGRPVIVNGLFVRNSAENAGGAIYNTSASELTLINCTLVNNSASEGSALAFDSFEQGDPSTAAVMNSILRNDRGEIWNNDGSQISVRFSNVRGGAAGPGNIDADPRFVGADDFHLRAGSPAIDAGDNAVVPAGVTDFDGEPRFRDDPGVADTGVGVTNVVDMGVYEFAADCNGNGIDDVVDVDQGTSLDCNGNENPDECEIDALSDAGGGPFFCVENCDADCNGNGIPDACDLLSRREKDCNGNDVPDACEISMGTVADCNADGIPDECSDDCNANGVPDDCDIAVGNSDDANANGFPDECEFLRNRYIAFQRRNQRAPTAYEITLLESEYFPDSVGLKWWVSAPNEDGIAGLSADPVYRDWSIGPKLIYVGGCPIVPASSYRVRATTGGGLLFAAVGTFETARRPADGRFFGDAVGRFDSIARGWTAPNGGVDANDILASLLTFERDVRAPHITVVDLDGNGISGITNAADIALFVAAFEIEPYPFESPADCP